MSDQLTVGAEQVPWYKMFDALEYVDNPYSLLAIIFLAVIVALSFSDIARDRLGAILTLFGVLIVATIFLLLRDSLDTLREKALVHLVNDFQAPKRATAEVAPGVTITLLDTASLEGKVQGGPKKSGLEFNRTLPRPAVDAVFKLAGVPRPADFWTMSQAQWEEFLDALSDEQADRVKDIPLAQLSVQVDGHDQDTSIGWWLKHQEFDVRRGERVMRVRLVNIYNTKSTSSGEPEAINLHIL